MKSLPPIQIAELQQRMAAHDQGALRILYEQYSDKLLHFACAIVRSRELAEEIVGDVFVKIWKSRERVSIVKNLNWYLFITTKNVSISYLRRFNRDKHINLDNLTLPYFQVDITPEDMMISNEILQRINSAINNLPPKCLLIFKLVKEDGLKHREVAELLQINLKTVENQVGIALKKIHASIHVHLPDLPRSLR